MQPDRLISPHLELYRYWQAKRGGRREPTRRDIDPAEIGRLLRHIALVEPSWAGYRWRLMGTAIAADIGRDLTGRRFGAHIGSPGFVKLLTASFDHVLTWRQPVFDECLCQTGSGGHQAVSRLLLPLGSDKNTAGMILLTRLVRSCQIRGEAPTGIERAEGVVHGMVEIRSQHDLARCDLAWRERVAPARAPGPIRIANLWSRSPVPYTIEA